MTTQSELHEPRKSQVHCPYCRANLYEDGKQYFCWTCRLSWKSLKAIRRDRKALGQELGR